MRKKITIVFMLLMLCFITGCGPAKYGKCQSCGKLYGFRGGNLPGQNSICAKCGGHIYYPPHKSAEYYQYKSEYGGTED